MRGRAKLTMSLLALFILNILLILYFTNNYCNM
jgi:hypothetical protein